MNNEETIIMQPKNEAKKSVEATNTTTPKETKKEEQKSNTTAKVAATAAAGVFGGAAGGAASVAAANMMGNQESVEEEPKEEVVAEAKSEPKAEPAPVVEEKAEEPVEVIVVPDEQEPDYSNQQGADPIVEPEPQPIPAGGPEQEPEVQILGVYERTTEDGVHQEMVILTDGNEVAAFVDVDGSGEADVVGVDHNHNGQFDEGEVYDVSDQHIGMEQYEQEYLAQQAAIEEQQQDTFAIEASDDQDYNNDVDFSMA